MIAIGAPALAATVSPTATPTISVTTCSNGSALTPSSLLFKVCAGAIGLAQSTAFTFSYANAALTATPVITTDDFAVGTISNSGLVTASGSGQLSLNAPLASGVCVTATVTLYASLLARTAATIAGSGATYTYTFTALGKC
ncbi:hypothetical protein [Rudaeicoccus suwonensis]|nr:hypothetical protein [Rudaeicoccus suwonensis]